MAVEQTTEQLAIVTLLTQLLGKSKAPVDQTFISKLADQLDFSHVMFLKDQLSLVLRSDDLSQEAETAKNVHSDDYFSGLLSDLNRVEADIQAALEGKMVSRFARLPLLKMSDPEKHHEFAYFKRAYLAWQKEMQKVIVETRHQLFAIDELPSKAQSLLKLDQALFETTHGKLNKALTLTPQILSTYFESLPLNYDSAAENLDEAAASWVHHFLEIIGALLKAEWQLRTLTTRALIDAIADLEAARSL